MRRRTPWVHRSYLKDGKLRVRERYSHGEIPSFDEGQPVRLIVIPDALVVRKYLPCIQSLLSDHNIISLRWILLESVTEYLDYRNQAPVLERSTRECAAIHERYVLQQLCAKFDSPSVFCDLSVRTEDDEWDLLRYDHMPIHDRSRNALLRAGNMVQRTINIAEVKVLIISEEIKDCDDEELQVSRFDAFIHRLDKDGIISSISARHLLDLALSCSEAYLRRNQPTKVSHTENETEDHLSIEDAEEGVRSGALQLGKLEITKEKIRERFVEICEKVPYRC